MDLCRYLIPRKQSLSSYHLTRFLASEEVFFVSGCLFQCNELTWYHCDVVFAVLPDHFFRVKLATLSVPHQIFNFWKPRNQAVTVTLPGKDSPHKMFFNTVRSEIGYFFPADLTGPRLRGRRHDVTRLGRGS